MDREEEVAFQALVLSALWGIWGSTGKDYQGMADWWRGLAIGHMDMIGQDTPEAKQYRRDVMFPARFGR